ncbi:MAG: AcvB/VirJ family lysyl-phosphatidylglycerol hydrolase [Chitinophagaceae bacterium]
MPQLPLLILPASQAESLPLVLMITGDGGWGLISRRLSKQFNRVNAPVVALNSWHLFRRKKTPEEIAGILESVLDKFMEQYHKDSFILAGYSFGADVIPFVLNRIQDHLLQHCAGVVLFSPGVSTDFKLHLLQMLGKRHQWKYDVVKEIQVMKPVKTLFFFGDKEHHFPYDILSRSDWQLIYLKGKHLYQKETADIAMIILERLNIK